MFWCFAFYAVCIEAITFLPLLRGFATGIILKRLIFWWSSFSLFINDCVQPNWTAHWMMMLHLWKSVSNTGKSQNFRPYFNHGCRQAANMIWISFTLHGIHFHYTHHFHKLSLSCPSYSFGILLDFLFELWILCCLLLNVSIWLTFGKFSENRFCFLVIVFMLC